MAKAKPRKRRARYVHVPYQDMGYDGCTAPQVAFTSAAAAKKFGKVSGNYDLARIKVYSSSAPAIKEWNKGRL